jgi:ABC-type xylose transport system permease subunit
MNLGLPVNIGDILGALAILTIAVGIATSETKFLIPEDAKFHDNFVQLLAILWGVVLALAAGLLILPGEKSLRVGLVYAVVGAVAAIGSVAHYHLVKTSAISDQLAGDLSSVLGTLQPSVHPLVGSIGAAATLQGVVTEASNDPAAYPDLPEGIPVNGNLGSVTGSAPAVQVNVTPAPPTT